MKINICKNHIFNYYGFVVQPGMLLGYDADNTPYVTNGNIHRNNTFNVYFMRGKDIFGKYIWKNCEVTEQSNQKLYDTILRGIRKRKVDKVKYMSALEIEFDKFGKEPDLFPSILFRGRLQNQHVRHLK